MWKRRSASGAAWVCILALIEIVGFCRALFLNLISSSVKHCKFTTLGSSTCAMCRPTGPSKMGVVWAEHLLCNTRVRFCMHALSQRADDIVTL